MASGYYPPPTANPLTTLGDVPYGGASGVPARLAGNLDVQPKFFSSVGTGVNNIVTKAFTALAGGGWMCAIHPSGNYLYACIPGLYIQIFPITAGVLGSPTTQAVSPGCYNVAVDAAGTYLYVAGFTGAFQQFSISGGGSTLTSVGTTSGVPNYVIGLCVDPSGNYLYVCRNLSSGNNLYVYPISAGVLGTPVLYATGRGQNAMAISPSGSHLYISGGGAGPNAIQVYTLAAGVPTFVGNVTIPGNVLGGSEIAIDSTGAYLYMGVVTATSTNQFISYVGVWAISGDALTFIGKIPGVAYSSPFGVAIDPAGGYLYVTYGTAAFAQVFTISAPPTSASTAPSLAPLAYTDLPPIASPNVTVTALGGTYVLANPVAGYFPGLACLYKILTRLGDTCELCVVAGVIKNINNGVNNPGGAVFADSAVAGVSFGLSIVNQTLLLTVPTVTWPTGYRVNLWQSAVILSVYQ